MEGTSDPESCGVGAPCVEGILGSWGRRQRELAPRTGRDMGCLRFSRSAHMRPNKPGVSVSLPRVGGSFGRFTDGRDRSW
jgi:hypothetical protein